MTRTELSEILERHRKWLAGEAGGQRADLRYADLCGANLCSANLSSANLSNADLRRVDLRYADLRGADLRGADLRGAMLRYTDLRGADLRGANLSGDNLYKFCLPLWCGGMRITLDRIQMAQLIYHFCSMECEDLEVKELQKSMYEFANEFAKSRDDLKNKKFPEA